MTAATTDAAIRVAADLKNDDAPFWGIVVLGKWLFWRLKMEFYIWHKGFSYKKSVTYKLSQNLRAAGLFYPAFRSTIKICAKVRGKITPPLGDLR